MILVLIFLGILVLLVTIITLIIASTLHIQIKNLSVSNMEPKNTNEYAIIFSLYLGNKIKWIWFRLNDKKVRKMYSKMQLEKLDFKKFRKDFNLDGSIVFHNTGITFYDNGAYTIYKGDE